MEELNTIFQNVNEWLKFAEAKHSGLIALTSALLLSVPALLKQPTKKWIRWFYILPCIAFGIALFISIRSFSPILKPIGHYQTKQIIHSHYFFGSLASMNEKDFLRDYMQKGDTITHLQKDLIEQILINSRITTSKMQRFDTALLFFQVGFLLLAVIYLSNFLFVKQSE